MYITNSSQLSVLSLLLYKNIYKHMHTMSMQFTQTVPVYVVLRKLSTIGGIAQSPTMTHLDIM